MDSIDIPRSQITGLVLAGGRGSRMGGVDKGLQLLAGQPLVAHALQRLAPQVGRLLVNANRHVDIYAQFGHAVVQDALPDHPGPLAGLLAGIDACTTPWLVTVPCDSPAFPLDLVARLSVRLSACLSTAVRDGTARVAIAATPADDGSLQPQPVFCLLHRALRDSLATFAANGRRSVLGWAEAQGSVLVPFGDSTAFVNANTADELAALQPIEDRPRS